MQCWKSVTKRASHKWVTNPYIKLVPISQSSLNSLGALFLSVPLNCAFFPQTKMPLICSEILNSLEDIQWGSPNQDILWKVNLKTDWKKEKEILYNTLYWNNAPIKLKCNLKIAHSWFFPGGLAKGWKHFQFSPTDLKIWVLFCIRTVISNFDNNNTVYNFTPGWSSLKTIYFSSVHPLLIGMFC